MGREDGFQLTRMESDSDVSGRDYSVRSGTACKDIGKDTGSSGVLLNSREFNDSKQNYRTGNRWTASAHVITAVIGSGVLSLAWSIAQLGWIAGPIVLISFSFITYYMSILLADCYRSPDPITGRRNHTYMDAARANLEGKQIWLCGLVQYTNLLGTAIGYTITASISMVAILRSDCFHNLGEDAPCHISNNMYMSLFGVIQIVLSQIPDFNRIWWLSIVAAIMSFSYSLIGLALSMGKASEKTHSYGTVTGVSIGLVSPAQKTWSVFQALGNIAFAYSFSMVLIEIQDTLKSPPPENKTMKQATLIGVIATTLFYMSVGCVGYAAFGNNAPGNLLTGFGFYNPYWLVNIANACIVVHLVGAYQVYTQPLFAFIENWASCTWPENSFIHKVFTVHIPFRRPLKFSAFKLLWRSFFVILTTLVSMLLPFFNDILGILGSLAFWPLTVYFPIAMYISQSQLKKWKPKWVALQIVNATSFLVSVAAGLGSLVGVMEDLKQYAPFKTRY